MAFKPLKPGQSAVPEDGGPDLPKEESSSAGRSKGSTRLCARILGLDDPAPPPPGPVPPPVPPPGPVPPGPLPPPGPVPPAPTPAQLQRHAELRARIEKGEIVGGEDDLPAPGSKQGYVPTKLTDSTGGSAGSTLSAPTNLDALTDSTGGAASTTFGAVPAGGTGAAAGGWDTSGHRDTAIANINNGFASVAAELAIQKTLNALIFNWMASVAAKLNQVIDLVREH